MKKHSRLKRIVSRAAFLGPKVPLVLISYFNHRVYMSLYLPLLRRCGMNLRGTPRYISASVYFDSLNSVTLGDRVVISSNVRFLTHDYSITTALIAIGEKPGKDIARERAITVGDNVFIGLSSILLPGTVIGNNVIVGAGSVLRGHVPSGSIVFGNPASVDSSIETYAGKCKQLLTSDLVRTD
jgi:acetyltransferase-like isoleucine patch superfamily enzyme